MSRIFKVLIVDDEFRIGLLINKLIHWDELGLQCIDTVDNGEAAIEILEEKHIDIVITDIRMPKINGLDLIRITKETNEELKYIVISGYKEFEYAHRALQYGVSDYLLKPIDETELNVTLGKLVLELKEKQDQIYEDEQMKQVMQTSEGIIKETVLNSLIDSEKDVSLQQINKEFNLDLKGERYRSINIKLDYWDYEKSDTRQDKITLDKVVSYIEQYVSLQAVEYLICRKENMYIYCLISYKDHKGKDLKDAINQILSEIQNYLIRFEQYEITFGIGDEKDEFALIKETIEEARRAIQNRIKLGTGRLIYGETINDVAIVKMGQYEQMYKSKFLNAIELYDTKKFEQIINEMYSEIQFMEDIDYSIFYEFADCIIEWFFDALEVESKEGTELKTFMKNTSQHCYTVNKLKTLLKQYLGEYLEVCKKISETEITKPIREAKKYIEENYANKIVLEDIAEIVELNPVYFSVLFKKETGMNFSSYLMNYRMEVAKVKIKMGNETIAAIAMEVGYKDSRYFSQMFTKVVGVKPAVYRRLHS